VLSTAAFRSNQLGASLEFHILLSKLYFFPALQNLPMFSQRPSSLALLRQSVRGIALEVLARIVRLHSHDFLSRGRLNLRQQLPLQRPCPPLAIPLSLRQGTDVGSLTIKNSGRGASNIHALKYALHALTTLESFTWSMFLINCFVNSTIRFL
jgi:hypothetical protein